MTATWTLPAWAVLATVLGLVLALLLAAVALLVGRRDRAASRLADDVLRAEVAALAAEVARWQGRRAPAGARASRDPADPTGAAAPAVAEFRITTLGEEPSAPGPVPTVAPPLFADTVLRETVVHATSLAAGVKRALAPETRARIRVEMRREVKRARKHRRAEAKRLLREQAARQRTAMDVA
ncbi:hypothetical protein [Nocardioides sp.]|uniref:hypothetical protein n=1 Tax=Nocardioides sp. TaxID=35761 RepID=UPI0035145E16